MPPQNKRRVSLRPIRDQKPARSEARVTPITHAAANLLHHHRPGSEHREEGEMNKFTSVLMLMLAVATIVMFMTAFAIALRLSRIALN